MKISKAWTSIGYFIAIFVAYVHGGNEAALIILGCCAWIDITSWASAWKNFR